jgi:hypothetical protein
MLPTYFGRHLDQIDGGGLLPKDYVLIENGGWATHPVFRTSCGPLSSN